MNKKFTKLMAALALLVFMTPSLAGWGQTRTEVTDVMDRTWTGVTGTSYTEVTGLEGSASDAVYTVQCAGSNNSIQLRSKNSNSGIVTTTTGGTATKVVVTWDSNTTTGNKLDVYGKNTAYNNPSDLYSSSSGTLIGSIVCGTSTELTITDSYTFIGMRSNNGAIYLTKIDVTWETGGSSATPTTVTIDASGITNTDVYASTTAGQLTASVTYDNNGTPTNVPNATVTWASSNTSVATVDAYGNVTLVAAGTTNITATFAGNDDYATSYGTYELEVTSSAPYVQPNPVVINMNYKWLGSTNGGNLDANQLPVEKVDDNVTTTIAKGTSSTNPRGDSDYIRLYKGSTLTFDAPEGYVMTSIEFTTGGNNTWNAPSVSTGTLSSKTWTGNAESVVFTMTGSCFISNATITLAAPASLHTLTATMSHVAEFYVFVGDNTNPIVFDDNNQVQVTEGATVGVSIAAMEDCFVFGSLTVNGSSAGVTQEDPNDPYFTFEMPEGDATIDVISSAAAQYTLTVGTLEHVTLELTAGEDSEPVQLTGNSADLCVGIHVTVIATADQGYTSPTLSVVDGNNQPIEVINEGENTFSFAMPAGNVTITATAEEVVPEGTIVFGNNGTKISSANVTGNDNLGNTWTITTTGTTSFTQNTSYSQVGKSTEPATSITFTTTLPNSVNITSFSAKFGGFNNTVGDVTLKVGETTVGTGSLNGPNDVTVSNTAEETGTVLTVTVTNIDKGVKCYFISYEYEVAPVPELPIAANQWYLISSPVGNVAPTAVGNMTPANGYALYRFDQNGDNEGKEWINYKGGAFNLEFGKGYLYANQAGCTLSFTGTPVAFSEDENMNVLPLTYVEGADLPGYNLLGNPFNETVWTDWDFYVMNGGEISLSSGQQIAPMQGFIVVAPGPDGVVTLNTGNPIGGKGASVALNVSRNRGNVIDRARVRMGEGRQLPKFQLFEGSTKVYIPQGDQDYAVVRSEGQGELPVNFSASENGTYTLSMDVENMDMNYLHLIDNMTGMDVDLLQTPSYTFEAKVNDYESRFRLVFAANNEDGVSTGSTAFAFFSNGNWIINNAGEATLQVVDLTGRILSSETVNGSVSKTINAVPGVYMLRLINGDNVNVQKIVVR